MIKCYSWVLTDSLFLSVRTDVAWSCLGWIAEKMKKKNTVIFSPQFSLFGIKVKYMVKGRWVYSKYINCLFCIIYCLKHSDQLRPTVTKESFLLQDSMIPLSVSLLLTCHAGSPSRIHSETYIHEDVFICVGMCIYVCRERFYLFTVGILILHFNVKYLLMPTSWRCSIFSFSGFISLFMFRTTSPLGQIFPCVH